MDDIKPLRRKQKLETDITQAFRDEARNRGWFVEKIVTTGRKGFPDSLYIRGGRVVFMEWKRDKTKKGERRGVLSAQQEKRIDEMRDAGAEVHVVYSLEQARDILDFL